MAYGYATQNVEERSARAQGINLPVSFKHSVEIGNYIRGNTVARAKAKLEAAIAKKEPIPFKRYTDGIGHRRGSLTSGRFPVKACSELLKLLNSAEANALFKGFSSKSLVISALVVKKAPATWRHGRQSRRQMKRAHVELIVSEVAKETRTVKATTSVPEQTPKKDVNVAKPKQDQVKEEKSTLKEKSSVEQKPIEKATENTVEKKNTAGKNTNTDSNITNKTQKQVDTQ